MVCQSRFSFNVELSSNCLAKTPDPYTKRGLKDCQAWIFKYDRRHSRLSFQARNVEIGNKAFARLAHHLATE
ncbi:unnamed protein product [marine sediment metagenome]|uniref:Uncharacterized protein n=1 Tax=marine sediment metagenome TaxID=412755 RepID=X1VD58_9ZZZZ